MPSKSFFSKVVPLLILILLFILVVFTLKPRSISRVPETGEKGIALVETARVVRGNLEPLFSALGSIEPRQQASVFSLVTGQLDKVLVNVGDKVQAGDVLAVINSSGIEAELKRVETELELAKAAPITELDPSKDGFLQALRIKQQVAREAELRQRLNDYTIRAPISGMVVKKNVHAGDTVAALGTVASPEPLFVIEDIESVYARAGIPEKFISQVQVGMKAKVRVGAYPLENFPLAIFQGQLARISPTINPETRTLDIWVEIPNKDGKLRPGMSSEVGLVIEHYKNVLLVPKEAIVKSEFQATEATIVYVIEDKEAIAQGKSSPVVARGVNLGLSDGVNYMIEETGKAGAQEKETSWLKEGDLVVTIGAPTLVDGQLVRAIR
ncbi:MAG TPA: efflux RND transporter periplasmic adaptor subunit [Candidatus Limnocylindrales bacterium]|nr:efflux RND transporter periplasmic adaptor subunit [Candidatus Limnocylindrales bacterium]